MILAFTVVEVGRIRRIQVPGIDRHTHIITDRRTQTEYPVELGSQASRFLRFFGGRVQMKPLMLTVITEDDGIPVAHYIDVI